MVLAGAEYATSKKNAKSQELISTLKGMGKTPGPKSGNSLEWAPADAVKAKERVSVTNHIGITEGWKGEEWGTDQLRPDLDTFRPQKPSPPHIKSPLGYTRRIEGLLQPEDAPVLAGN